MKKTRNAFISEYQNPNMMIPNQGVAANTNFYAGPMPMNQNMYTDIDSRLSRLERQINRLETRVSHLEGSNPIIDEQSYSNQMYMV